MTTPDSPPIRNAGAQPPEFRRRSFMQQVAGAPLAAGMLFSAARPGPAAAQTPPGRSAASARGKVLHVGSEIREFRDPDTGARVRRLTPDGSDNVHLYFTTETFLSGSGRVVFGSNRSGRFQLYLLEIGEGRLVQLTDVQSELDPQQACLSPAGTLFYFDGPALHALRVDTLEDREIYRVPEGWGPHLATCTPDGKYVAFAYGERLAVSTETGRIYSTMAESFFQHPRCVIMRIEAGNGQAVAAWGDKAWISHVMIHPSKPDLILFCQEGGSLSAQRMWTVNIGVVRGRVAEPLYPQKPNEYCVHEYFTRQGEVGFQYEVEREGHIESYNAFIRPDGTWLRQYLLPGRRPLHIQSNTDNSLVVGDAGYLSPDDKDGGKYISLMTHPNGRVAVRRLCRYQVAGTQHSHGHPVFSLDDRWVLFNSQVNGRDNIFMADVHSI